MKLIFIRHGLSEANKARVISGSKDVSLSEEGKSQLINIRNKTAYPKSDFNVVTGLIRTHETFNILFPDRKIDKIEKRFSEISFGDYEGKSFDEIDLDDYFKRLYHNEVIGNNETMNELYQRVQEGLVELILELKENNHSSATIVAHSTVIRIVVVKALGDTYEIFKDIKPKNGLGYVVDIDVVDGNIVYNGCEIL